MLLESGSACYDKTMGIRTPFTECLGIDRPVVLAPMAAISGGRLAAAVSNAGGLGLVGGGYGDADWLRRELPRVVRETRKPWGVGFITWRLTHDVLALALDHRPSAVMLSFGDPAAYVPAIKRAGARLICQVHDVGEARDAVAVGADVIVAQGTEAGGHGSARSTLPLVRAVADAVAPTPVVAAGGIVDGRGLAAALMLGAQGVLMGTRFYASHESLAHERVKQRLVQGSAAETRRTRVFDAGRGLDWPEPYTGRAFRNAFAERWEGREAELRGDDAAQAELRVAIRDGDIGTAVVWAGEGVDLIDGLEYAGELVRRMVDVAEETLREASRWLTRQEDRDG